MTAVFPLLKARGVDPAGLPHAHGLFNVVAFLEICAITTILVIGIKESANINSGFVVLKIAIVLLFIAVAGNYALHHPGQAIKN